MKICRATLNFVLSIVRLNLYKPINKKQNPLNDLYNFNLPTKEKEILTCVKF